jgi:arylsulfatase A-like enzyme
VLFEDAHTPVPVTLAAHTTMLTGQYPFAHGVRNNGSYILGPEAVTLPELLKKKGYATGAVIGAFPLDARFGLNQGFDAYDDRFPAESVLREGDTAQRPAAEVSRLALAWVDQHQTGPFFLWCHYFDAHAPHQPIEPYKSRFPGDAYAAEIAAMDAGVGALLDGLRSRGLLDKTVILVAGDHGEGLDEHGEHTHTTFIYETTQRVPLLLRLPAQGPFSGRAWRGARVSGLVGLCDLLPTAWNALGFARAELPPGDGLSLLPVITNDSPAHSWLYHETLVPKLEYGASDLRGWQDARYKFIRAPQPELYDEQKDPHELKSIADREPERVQRMGASLDSLLRRDTVRPAAAMDQETVEKLRRLGYLGGSNASGAAATVEPKEVNRMMKALEDAETQAALFHPRRALAMLDSLLKAHPGTPVAQ